MKSRLLRNKWEWAWFWASIPGFVIICIFGLAALGRWWNS